MKHLLPSLFVAVLISGCSGKYGSEYEAKAACDEWEEKADFISFEYETVASGGYEGIKAVFESETIKKDNRECRNEVGNNQYLGIEYTFLKEDLEKDGTTLRQYRDNEGFKYGYEDSKVVKYFKY